MIGIEVNTIDMIEETSKTETGHMIEVEAGMETTYRDSAGIEETSRSRNRGRSTSGDKSEESRCHYHGEPGHL